MGPTIAVGWLALSCRIPQSLSWSGPRKPSQGPANLPTVCDMSGRAPLTSWAGPPPFTRPRVRCRWTLHARRDVLGDLWAARVLEAVGGEGGGVHAAIGGLGGGGGGIGHRGILRRLWDSADKIPLTRARARVTAWRITHSLTPSLPLLCLQPPRSSQPASQCRPAHATRIPPTPAPPSCVFHSGFRVARSRRKPRDPESPPQSPA